MKFFKKISLLTLPILSITLPLTITSCSSTSNPYENVGVSSWNIKVSGDKNFNYAKQVARSHLPLAPKDMPSGCEEFPGQWINGYYPESYTTKVIYWELVNCLAENKVNFELTCADNSNYFNIKNAEAGISSCTPTTNISLKINDSLVPNWDVRFLCSTNSEIKDNALFDFVNENENGDVVCNSRIFGLNPVFTQE